MKNNLTVISPTNKPESSFPNFVDDRCVKSYDLQMLYKRIDYLDSTVKKQEGKLVEMSSLLRSK